MASRTKKDATEAMTRLKSYLRRDQQGQRLLAIVSRYLGELKQERTTLRDQLALTARNAEAASKQRISAEHNMVDLRAQLERLTAMNRQLTGDLAKTQIEVDSLKEELHPTDGMSMPDAPYTPHISELTALWKRTRRRVKQVPTARTMPKDLTWVRPVHLSDVISDYDDDACLTAGLLAVFCALIGMPVLLLDNVGGLQAWRVHGKGQTDRAQARFFQWMAPWIGETPLENRLIGSAREQLYGTPQRIPGTQENIVLSKDF